jgi:hypothetical protein
MNVHMPMRYRSPKWSIIDGFEWGVLRIRTNF